MDATEVDLSGFDLDNVSSGLKKVELPLDFYSEVRGTYETHDMIYMLEELHL